MSELPEFPVYLLAEDEPKYADDAVTLFGVEGGEDGVRDRLTEMSERYDVEVPLRYLADGPVTDEEERPLAHLYPTAEGEALILYGPSDVDMVALEAVGRWAAYGEGSLDLVPADALEVDAEEETEWSYKGPMHLL